MNKNDQRLESVAGRVGEYHIEKPSSTIKRKIDWLRGVADIRRTSVCALRGLGESPMKTSRLLSPILFAALFLLVSAMVQAGTVYTWKGVGGYGAYIGTQYQAICGTQPSGCQDEAMYWIKADYPPPSDAVNVVWHSAIVSESGPPTQDGQYGGFTLCYSVEYDYVSIYPPNSIIHISTPSGGQCQQIFFYTIAAVRASYYVAASPIAILFAENGSSCPAGGNSAAPPMSYCGDPINPASGNTYKSTQDLSASDLSSIAFIRFYNSKDSTQNNLGTGWRGSFSRSVKANASIASYQPLSSAGSTYSSLYNDEASACTSGFAQIQSQVPNWSGAIASFSNGVCSLSKGGTYVASLAIYSAYNDVAPEPSPPSFDYINDNGQVTRFSVINGVITAPPGYGLKLAQTAGGYTLTDGSDNVETYDVSGKLLSVTSRSGMAQSMFYDGSGRLSGVTDSFGHQLTLGYDAQGHLTAVTRQ